MSYPLGPSYHRLRQETTVLDEFVSALHATLLSCLGNFGLYGRNVWDEMV